MRSLLKARHLLLFALCAQTAVSQDGDDSDSLGTKSEQASRSRCAVALKLQCLCNTSVITVPPYLNWINCIITQCSSTCLDMVFWSAVQLQKLEAAIAVARKDIQANPKDAMQYVQLATLLHKADYMAPDGGSRIAEAEDAYRYCDGVRLSAQLVASQEPSLSAAAATPLAVICRSAIRHAPNSAMEAGVLGNMGALLLGVAGRVEDGLDAINRCIARFYEARIVANPLYAGQLLSFSNPLRHGG